MNYCIAACDQFESIKDPNNSGHVCYRSKYEIGRIELRRIMDDPTFVFIKDNIVYFKK